MSTPVANLRPTDRHRAIRATLGFIREDSLALDAVLREAAEDTNPTAVTALLLAAIEQSATMIGAQPDGEEMLAQALLEYAADND